MPGPRPGLVSAPEHQVSSAGSATAIILCAGPQGGTLPPAVVTLVGGRRLLVTGESPPPAERSGGCREPAVKVAVCGRAGWWHGAGRRQETCEIELHMQAGPDATSSFRDDVTSPRKFLFFVYSPPTNILSGTNLWQTRPSGISRPKRNSTSCTKNMEPLPTVDCALN